MTKHWCPECSDMAEIYDDDDWRPCPAGCVKREPEMEPGMKDIAETGLGLAERSECDVLL